MTIPDDGPKVHDLCLIETLVYQRNPFNPGRWILNKRPWLVPYVYDGEIQIEMMGFSFRLSIPRSFRRGSRIDTRDYRDGRRHIMLELTGRLFFDEHHYWIEAPFWGAVLIR